MPAKTDRADRLKAALKANMARRKAQRRARDEEEGAETPEAGPDRNEEDERNG